MKKGKKSIGILIAGLDKGDGGGEGGGGGSDKVKAAQRLIDAVKAGNARKASMALEEHYLACQAEEGDEERDEMDSEDESEDDEDY